MKDIGSHLTTFPLLLMMMLCVERDLAICPNPGTINPKYGWQVSSGGTNLYGYYGVGTVIQFYCKYNFKLAKYGQPKIICKEDGTWTGKIPKCVALSCLDDAPHVPFVTTTYVYKCHYPYPVGCPVKYTCINGYNPVHDPVKTCDKDGQWKGNFYCKRIECPPPSALLNGKTSVTSLHFSSNVTYTCEDGYVLKGVKRRVCRRTGQWSDSKPVCVILCRGPVFPKHGNWTVVGDVKDLSRGTILQYNCDERYKLVGESSPRVCQNDGLWSGTAPKCVLNSCADIKQFESQPQIIYSTSSRIIGSVATFECFKDGYTLKGPQQRTCLPSGVWSGENPTCIYVVCDAPNTPQFGKVLGQPSEDNTYRYNSVVTYVCDATFYLWGNITRKCVIDDDGHSYWTGGDPECLTLVQYEERCKKKKGYHLQWSSTKPLCVPEKYIPPTTGDVGKAPRSRELDTLTIVTACAGSTLGALVILLIVLVCVRKLHRTRRFRHAAFRSRRYSYDDDRVALIAAYASDVHFILPSYDEAINQVDRSPPPFESVVCRDSDTSNNNDRGAPGDGQNSGPTSASGDGRIHIVFNPMAERRNVHNETERASIIEIPTESHEATFNQQPSEGTGRDSSENVVDSRNNSTEC